MSESVFRVLIVDDEPLARTTLRRLLMQDEEIEVVGEGANGEEALELIRSERPELVFLDVEMPGMGGMEVLSTLAADERPAVVFTTAFEQYALGAFEAQALDYLLKPFDDERFRESLARAKERLRRDALARRVADEGTYSSRLSFHKEGRVEVIHVEELDWVQAADQYVLLHVEEDSILVRKSMGDLERLLDPARFPRVHRSAIVALDRVTRLESLGGGTGRLLLRDGTWVPVSRSRVAAIRRLLG